MDRSFEAVDFYMEKSVRELLFRLILVLIVTLAYLKS
jgi:hypothetical protein